MLPSDDNYIYAFKVAKGYVYYSAPDAVTALCMANADYKDAKIVDVCTDDIDLITFAVYRKRGKL